MTEKRFVEVDSDMLSGSKIKEPDIRFLDVRGEPFELYGLYNPRGDAPFRRLPDEVGKNVNPGVARLYLCTAGGRVRFSTDSAYVALRAAMPYIGRYDHMPLTNACGFDLCVDTEAGSRFYRPFRPGCEADSGYEAVIRFSDKRMRSFTVNFPSYNPVDTLYIGLQRSADVAGGARYRSALPVVFYGSSITQGACASHPANTYESIISRRMNLDYINLGFSGSGLAEESIARHMASLPMLAFVSDYDHNAPDAEYLEKTHGRLYEIIREKHPDIPYVMLSRPDYDVNPAESIARRDVIIDTYHSARAAGDKNVYYIDGQGIFRGPDEDLCTVDGTHPTDVGFMKMADAVERVLVRALRRADFNGEER